MQKALFYYSFSIFIIIKFVGLGELAGLTVKREEGAKYSSMEIA